MRSTFPLCALAALTVACTTTQPKPDDLALEAKAKLTPAPTREAPEGREAILSRHESISTLSALVALETEDLLELDWPCGTTLNTGGRSVVVFDDSGRPVEIEADYMLTGNLTTGKFLTEYDANGLVTREHGCIDADVQNCNGDNFESAFDRDAEGRVETHRSFFLRDGGREGSGGLVSVTRFFYGKDPLVVTKKETSGLGGDGDAYTNMMLVSESTSVVRYLPGFTNYASIEDPTGLSYTNTFDAEGRRVASESTQVIEETGEKQAVTQNEYTFDEEGRVSTRVVRSFSIETGEIEYEYTFTYAYDADRPIRLVSVTRDDDVVITPDYTCHEAK